MAIEVMQDVWRKATKLRGTETLLLLALADAADPVSRTCWPSVKRLAEMARCNERRVQRLIRDLEARGYLTTTAVAGRSNRYTITAPEAWEGWPTGQGCTVGHPGPQATPGVAHRPPAPDNGGHPNRKEPSGEPSGENGRQRKATGTRPRKDADPRVHPVRQHFLTRYEEYIGSAYPADWARDGKLLGALPKALDVDALVALVDRFFTEADDFTRTKTGFTIPAFVTRIPALQAKTARNLPVARSSRVPDLPLARAPRPAVSA